MSVLAAEIIVGVAAIYAAIGVLFALVFVSVGWKHVGASDSTGTLGFRILIIPGSALLWPWLLFRWFSHSSKGKIRIVNLDVLRRCVLFVWLALIPIAGCVIVAAVLMRPERAASSDTTSLIKVKGESDASSGGSLRE